MLGYANPWEARKEIGYFKALWETVKEVCLKPAQFFENLEIRDKYSDTLTFYYFIGGISVLLSIAVYLIWGFAFTPKFSILPLEIGIVILSEALKLILQLYIGSAVLHLFVMAFKGECKYKATLNIVAYSAAVLPIGVIPFIGQFIALIWISIITVVGFKKIHKFSTAKAIAVYLFYVAIVIGLLVYIGFLKGRLQ